jgi:hypothetical protein
MLWLTLLITASFADVLIDHYSLRLNWIFMLAGVIKDLDVERWVLYKILWWSQCLFSPVHWLLIYSIMLLFRVFVTYLIGAFHQANWFVWRLFHLTGCGSTFRWNYGSLINIWETFVCVYVRYGRLISHIFYLLLIIWIVLLFIGYFIYFFQLTFLLNRRFKSVALLLGGTTLLPLSFDGRYIIWIGIFRVVCQIRCLYVGDLLTMRGLNCVNFWMIYIQFSQGHTYSFILGSLCVLTFNWGPWSLRITLSALSTLVGISLSL